MIRPLNITKNSKSGWVKVGSTRLDLERPEDNRGATTDSPVIDRQESMEVEGLDNARGPDSLPTIVSRQIHGGESSTPSRIFEVKKEDTENPAGNPVPGSKTPEQSEGASHPLTEMVSSSITSVFRVTLITISLGFITVAYSLDFSMIPIILYCFSWVILTRRPQLTTEFGALNDFGWYISAYFAASATGHETFRVFYREFGVKWTFILSLLWFEVGVLICGLASNGVVFIVGRALVGIGVKGIGEGVSRTIALIYRPLTVLKVRAMIGTLTMVFSRPTRLNIQVATILGPLLAGIFVDHLTWRWCFYVNLPFASIIVLLAVILNYEAAPSPPHQFREKLLAAIDVWGILLLGPAVVAFIIAAEFGGVGVAWNSPKVIAPFVVSFIALVMFTALRIKDADRIRVPLPALKLAVVPFPSLVALFTGGASAIPLYWLPFYFQVLDNTTATRSAINLLPLIVSSTLLMLLTGSVIHHRVFAAFAVFGLSFMIAGLELLATLSSNSSFGHWFSYEILVGAGWAVASMVMSVYVDFLMQDPSQCSFSPERASINSVCDGVILDTSRAGGVDCDRSSRISEYPRIAGSSGYAIVDNL